MRFIKNNPKIPEEMYCRWWQVVNEEFGQIISENEVQNEAGEDVEEEVQSREPRHESNYSQQTEKCQAEKYQAETQANLTRKLASNTERPTARMTRQEEEELADYLDIGLSITEARMMRQKELELAALKQKIRENKRDGQREKGDKE